MYTLTNGLWNERFPINSIQHDRLDSVGTRICLASEDFDNTCYYERNAEGSNHTRAGIGTWISSNDWWGRICQSF